MKRDEYEKGLIYLYGKAIEIKDFRLAFDLLECGRAAGVENMGPDEVEHEDIS